MESAAKVQKNWLADVSVGIIGILALVFGIEFMPAYIAGSIAGAIWGVGGFYTTKAEGVWKSVPLRVGMVFVSIVTSGALAHLLQDWLRSKT